MPRDVVDVFWTSRFGIRPRCGLPYCPVVVACQKYKCLKFLLVK